MYRVNLPRQLAARNDVTIRIHGCSTPTFLSVEDVWSFTSSIRCSTKAVSLRDVRCVLHPARFSIVLQVMNSKTV